MNDLTQDWPPDPDHAELARLAEQIQAAAVPLSADALARIEERLQFALRRQRRWRMVRSLGAAAAAIVLLVIGVYYVTRPGEMPIVVQQQPPTPAIVEQTVQVVVSTGSTVALEKPLLRLDDYQSLFTTE